MISVSNWLDKLRSSRGFPTGHEPDLDRFISSSSSSGSAPTTTTESTQSHSASHHHKKHRRKSTVVVSAQNDAHNVLCDLFNMGEPESSRTFSKSSRKQANPRFCGALKNNSNNNNNELCSSDDLRREKSENALASSGDNSLNNNSNVNVNNNGGDVGEERENEDFDLKMYSRSDVMVIDTSLPDWKFDGWVFRKNDEWKIKEKKTKSRVFGGKKKKLILNNLGDEKLDDDDKKMKNKDEESLVLLNKGQSHLDKKEEPCKQVADFPSKVPQKRFPCPRPPEKLRTEGSPVILLKSIPLNNSNEAPRPGKNPRKNRPKKMKLV